jgi:hypothetical protein
MLWSGEGPQLTIRRMRIAWWKPKATNTHSEYVILVAFVRQQWLRERASIFCYTHVACLVKLFTGTEKVEEVQSL